MPKYVAEDWTYIDILAYDAEIDTAAGCETEMLVEKNLIEQDEPDKEKLSAYLNLKYPG